LKAVVLACGAVGAAAIGALSDGSIEISLVLTCGEDAQELTAACKALGMDTMIAPADFEGLLDKIERAAADIILTANFHLEQGHRLTAASKEGAFGLHPALLPLHPGPDPVARAIMNDDKKTGVTLFRFDKKPGSVFVIDSQEEWIDNKDDAMSLEEKLAKTAAKVLSRSLPAMKNREGEKKRLDLPEAEPAVTPEEGRIDWKKRAWDAYNAVRALAGREHGAYSYLAGERMEIRKASPDDTNIGILYPGEFEADQGKVLVGASFGALRLDRVEWQGRTLEGVEIAAVLEDRWRDKFE